MTTAVLFVVFLLVVAGLVAAAGDRMGHLAARRKIRFGKMRPRNVSTLIAVITGLTISLVTFLILFSLWENFRDALLRHGEVRANLAAAQHQLAQASTDLKAAQDQTQQAVNEKSVAEQELADLQAELTDLQAEMSDLRGQVTESEIELNKKNQLIASREREVADLTTRRDELQKEVSTLAEFEQISLKILPEYARLKGEIVYAQGTYLSYFSVAPTEVDTLKDDLQRALEELSSVLEAQGLSLDEEARSQAQDLAANYPYQADEYGSVVIFSTARDVASGGTVELEITAQSLKPLVKAGEELLSVLVEDSQATVAWRNQTPSEFETFNIPADFDENSLEEFKWQLFLAFNRGGKASGFLPNLESGEIANPVPKLIDDFDTLAQQPRPFTIQFVANSDANALQGLADCSIYIAPWPPRPQE